MRNLSQSSHVFAMGYTKPFYLVVHTNLCSVFITINFNRVKLSDYPMLFTEVQVKYPLPLTKISITCINNTGLLVVKKLGRGKNYWGSGNSIPRLVKIDIVKRQGNISTELIHLFLLKYKWVKRIAVKYYGLGFCFIMWLNHNAYIQSFGLERLPENVMKTLKSNTKSLTG